jgi:hypothetical protein
MSYINKYNKYLIKNIQKGGLSVNDKILYEGNIVTVALIENGRVYISYDNDPDKNIYEITMKSALDGEINIKAVHALMHMKHSQPLPQGIMIQNKSVYIQNGTENKVYVTDVTADTVTCVKITKYISKRDFNVNDSQTVIIPIADFNQNYSKFS